MINFALGCIKAIVLICLIGEAVWILSIICGA